MERTEPEHVVESVDEAIAIGAEELGMDESELRAQIDALRFRPTDSDGSAATAEQGGD